MSADEVFRRITEALDRADIPYMLTGSFASVFYGSPRATQDIDIVVAPTPEQLRGLTGLLPKDEYYVDLDAALESLRRQSLFNIIDMATGWKIDLIIRKSRAFSQEEFRRRQLAQLHGASVFVASPEDIVVSKLEWAKIAQSQRHIADVAGILRVHGLSLDRAYIEKWVTSMGLSKEWEEARRAADV